MKLLVNKKLLYFAIILIVLCEPVYISYSYMDPLFKVGKIFLFCYAIFELVCRNKISNRSKTFYCLILYELILLVSTVINGTSLYHWALYGINFVSIFYFTEKNIRVYKERAIKCVLVVFLGFLGLNLFSALFDVTVRARGTTYYFLGLRTRVTDSVYVFLLALLLYMGKRNFKKFQVLGMLSLIGSLLIFNVSTMIIGLTIFVVLFVSYRWHVFRNLVANRFFLVVVATAIIGVVVFRIQQNMNSLFALFGKSSDLNYRTYIWDSALSKIKESPISFIFGHGVTELGEWASFEGRRWQAHDQFLQVTLDGGILALACFILMVTLAIRYCLLKRTDKKMYACVALFISYVVVMITEIYSYYPQFFVILAMLANAEYLRNDEQSMRYRGDKQWSQ